MFSQAVGRQRHARCSCPHKIEARDGVNAQMRGKMRGVARNTARQMKARNRGEVRQAREGRSSGSGVRGGEAREAAGRAGGGALMPSYNHEMALTPDDMNAQSSTCVMKSASGAMAIEEICRE